MLSTLLGSETVEKIMCYIVTYGQGSPSGIAKTFGMNKNRVYSQLLRLESGGILVATSLGNQRLFELNPRCIFKNELTALIEKYMSALPQDEIDAYYAQRRRPRRTGKEL